jgi:hypothetical protein
MQCVRCCAGRTDCLHSWCCYHCALLLVVNVFYRTYIDALYRKEWLYSTVAQPTDKQPTDSEDTDTSSGMYIVSTRSVYYVYNTQHCIYVLPLSVYYVYTLHNTIYYYYYYYQFTMYILHATIYTLLSVYYVYTTLASSTM